jgi:hypothetical protein
MINNAKLQNQVKNCEINVIYLLDIN